MTNTARKLLLGMLGGGGGIIYLFRDLFTTDLAAGSVNATNAEPGPGARSVTDGGNIISITGGALTINGTASGDSGVYYATKTRAGGRAFKFRFSSFTSGGLGRMGLGAASVSSSFTSGIGLLLSSASSFAFYPGGTQTVAPGPIPGNAWLICRPTAGYFYVHDTTLRFVEITGTLANLAPRVWIANAQSPNFALDEIAVTDLTGAVATDYGMATARGVVASSGDELTHTANAFIEATWTAGAGETFVLMFRRTDDNNCLKVVVDQAAGTWGLYKREGGVDSAVLANGSATYTVATAYRVCASAINNAIRCWIGVAGSMASSAAVTNAFNNTATNAKISGAGAADFITWPTDWSSVVPP
jgi:hypothetical protein